MMTFKPPHPPESLATLQVECVACKELFTLAEGLQNTKPGQQNWHSVLTVQPFIRMRFMAARFVKTTRPQHRPQIYTPQAPAAADKDAEHVAINCPRCGADNRNWVQIWSSLAWPDFWPVSLGLLAGLAILAAAAWKSLGQPDTGNSLFLLLAITLSFLLPSLLLPLRWPAEREYRNGRDLLPYRPLLSPAQRTALFVMLLLVFILPGFLFIARPLGFDYANKLLSPPASPPSLPERIQQVRQQITVPLTTTLATERGAAEDAIVALETVLKISPAPENEWADRASEALNQASRLLATNPHSDLKEKIVAQVAILETFIAQNRAPRIDQEYLKTWLMYVGAASLSASLFGWAAVSLFISQVNHHLPRPLYYSLADMTRVVAWEVKRVLELDGDMSQMEWLEAERNELGGLDLIGIMRMLPEEPPETAVSKRYEPARRYEVMTDPWGRIVAVEARDIQVPVYGSPRRQSREPDDTHAFLEELFRPRSTYSSL